MKPNEVKMKSLINQRGQVAVEYVLLLLVGVTIWITLVTQLVSRNPQKPGVIINKWQQILEMIGADDAADPGP